MHTFLGFSISEWVGMITIASSLIGGLVFLFRRLVVSPLIISINHVADELVGFKQDTKEDHQRYDHKLDDHERRIDRLEQKEEE